MTVTFPLQLGWLPNQTQLSDSARSILAVMGAALDQAGRGEPYERRVFSHGLRIPWKRGQPGKEGQLLVSVSRLFIGKAGVEQYQFADGEYGKLGKRTVEFTCQVVNKWPTPQGGTSPRLEPDESLEDATVGLWQDGFIVVSAMWSVATHSRSGVNVDPPIAPIVQNNVLIGSIQPVGPQGGLAGWEFGVLVQL